MSAIDSLTGRELVFVTGKGGVGKTTVAAALAVDAARRGRRVLVCELEGRSDLSAVFEEKPMRFKPRQLDPNVWGMTLTTEESLREYLKIQLRLPVLAPLGPLARAFDFVAAAAPGVKEILTVGKIAYEVRERHFDLVVVDAPATGHVIGQLRSPRVIDELVAAGPVHREVRWMLDILEDRDRTGAVVVTTADELPVSETVELLTMLRHEPVISPSLLVANRVVPSVFDAADHDRAAELRRDPLAAALEAVVPGAVAVLETAEVADQQRRSQEANLARLRSAAGDELTVAELPELFIRASGRRSVHRLADALHDAGGAP